MHQGLEDGKQKKQCTDGVAQYIVTFTCITVQQSIPTIAEIEITRRAGVFLGWLGDLISAPLIPARIQSFKQNLVE